MSSRETPSEALRQTLESLFDAKLAADFMACVAADFMRGPMASIGLCKPDATADDVLLTYLSDSGARRFNPNELFDEQWYRAANLDVAQAIERGVLLSGFVHFLMSGAKEGRWPNSTLHTLEQPQDQVLPPVTKLDADRYLNANAQARLFLASFPILTPLEHYNIFGRRLGLGPAGVRGKLKSEILKHYDILAVEFDPEYYRERYINGADPRLLKNPFQHYLMHGLAAAHSPNSWFDEKWYRAFYPDIRGSIRKGKIPCGFYHYVVAGRTEGRLPAFDQQAALEARSPGIARPVLLDGLYDIERRLRPIQARSVSARPCVVWFLLPTLNPDIMFGGYQAALHLLQALRGQGYRVAVICTEDNEPDKDYFLWREGFESMKPLLRDLAVYKRSELEGLDTGENDAYIAYSVWDLYLADYLARQTRRRKAFLFAQEYEPIFYPHSSARAVAVAGYSLPHYPIVNSAVLLKFFKQNKIGVFGSKREPEPFRDYAVFEHRVNAIAPQSAVAMAARKRRLLAVYARPEAHAARNLFEILVLALRVVCDDNLFGPDWSFIGLGTLTALDPVPLGRGHQLKFVPRMPGHQYAQQLTSLDIGVSLMDAPHPSLMPFEFATTGAIVVTNTYENRSADDLRAICRNFEPCEPSIQGVAAAIRRAIMRVNDFDARAKNVLRPRKTEWEDIFHADWLRRVFGSRDGMEEPRNRTTSAAGIDRVQDGMKLTGTARTKGPGKRKPPIQPCPVA